MLLIYLLLMCIIFVSICFAGIYNGIKEYRQERRKEVEFQQKRQLQIEAMQIEKEKREKIATMITKDFAKIGWDNWSENIHRYPEQYTRLERAINENPSICQYDKKMNIAKISSTHKDKCYLVSNERCSCPDFRSRNLPCKHIYNLAIVLAECIENGEDITSYTQDEYGIFYGLSFSLSGRGQDSVKKFIIDNGGTYRVDSWRGTSAVISVDGKYTQRVADAEFRNIAIFSPEQLMSLFNQ